MKVLIDMNLPPRLAALLVRAGIDAVHWSQVGKSDAKDIELFSYARDKAYVLLTCDLDFSAILANTNEQKPSVAQLRLQAVEPERDAPAIAAALLQSETALEKGAILTIDTEKYRLRLLPLLP